MHGSGEAPAAEAEHSHAKKRKIDRRFCRKCKNHGLLVPRRSERGPDSHPARCAFESCMCRACSIIQRLREKDRAKTRHAAARAATGAVEVEKHVAPAVEEDPGPPAASVPTAAQAVPVKRRGKRKVPEVDYAMASRVFVFSPCPKCINHDMYLHKGDGHSECCQYASCTCVRCAMVDRRRIKFMERMLSSTQKKKTRPSVAAPRVGRRRRLVCARCLIHGQTEAWNHRHGKSCSTDSCCCEGCPAFAVQSPSTNTGTITPDSPTANHLFSDSLSLCKPCRKHRGDVSGICPFSSCTCDRCSLVKKKGVCRPPKQSQDLDEGSQDSVPGGDQLVQSAPVVHNNHGTSTNQINTSAENAGRRNPADSSTFDWEAYLTRWAANVVQSHFGGAPTTPSKSQHANDPPAEFSRTQPVIMRAPKAIEVPEPKRSQSVITTAPKIIGVPESQRSQTVIVRVPETMEGPKPKSSQPNEVIQSKRTSSEVNHSESSRPHELNSKSPRLGRKPDSSRPRLRTGLLLCVECDVVLETEELFDRHVCGKEDLNYADSPAFAPTPEHTQVPAAGDLWLCNFCHERQPSRAKLACHHIKHHAWDSRSSEGAGDRAVTDQLVTLERLLQLFTLLNDAQVLTEDTSLPNGGTR